jgi:hypothetical protein
MATTQTTTANPTVKIIANDRGNPPGKLADAELHFTDSVLAGLKLIGFSVWERGTGGRNVTLPSVLIPLMPPLSINQMNTGPADIRHRTSAVPLPLKSLTP